MNILYDYQTFSRQRYGGISRYFHELISRVVTMADHEVHLFMGFHINRYGLERHRAQMVKYSGIRHPDVRHTFRMRQRLNSWWLRQFTAHSSVDVYHPTYYDDTAEIGKKRVITVHDMIYERFPEFFRPNDPASEEKRKAAQRADGVICVSESTRDDFCDVLKFPREKTTVVYHGNSLRFPAKPVNPIGRPYLLYVGKRSGYKNFGVLLRAYVNSDRLRNELHLLCFGPEKASSEERLAIASYGVGDKVHFMSGGDELLAQCYANASVFVCPSLVEGFGIPLIEAMYHGCPVVASDVPSLRETAGDAALFAVSDSPDHLGDAVGRILDDSQLRGDLIQRGFLRERQFSWDRCADETVAFYRQVCEHD